MYPKIEVIAHHTPGEPPRPLRLRFKGADEHYITGRVERVTERKIERLMGNVMHVYRIEAIIEGNRKNIGLKYERDTMFWYLTP